MGQAADEADGVGDERVRAGHEFDSARGGIQRREEAVLDEQVGAGERTQDRGFAGVGVADQRGAELTRPPFALRGPLPGDDLELAAQVADAAADQATVRLQLRLAGSAEADAAADAREVRPHPLEARQHVLELRQLDLHLRLRAARPRREDVEDQLGAVHDADAEPVLQVLALRRRQVLVEDDQRGARLLRLHLQLVDLAFAQVVLRVRRFHPLYQRARHAGARRIREAGQLGEMFVRLAGRGAARRHGREDRDFLGRLRRDHALARRRIAGGHRVSRGRGAPRRHGEPILNDPPRAYRSGDTARRAGSVS